MTLRTFSYGGGVQSTAALVLAAQGRIDFPVFLFANVGDDSEHPDTLVYVRDIAMPYAALHGIQVHELQRHKRDGTIETLWGRMMGNGPDSNRLPIPIRMANGAPGDRSCTADFKVHVLTKWLKANGATKDDPAIVGIGISVDEIHRASGKHGGPVERIVYPLLDLNLRRSDCANVIRAAGLPVPPKSSCFFCPFHRMTVWIDMKRERPDLFAKSVELERTLNEVRTRRGKDHVWLTRKLVPLERATGDGVQQVFELEDGPETCDSGHCWT